MNAPPLEQPPVRGRALRRLGLVTTPEVLPGNRVDLLVNGADYFPALLEAIEGAARSVFIETYIFADDNIGQRVTDALAAAAGRGVDVRLVIDGFGGGWTRADVLRIMKDSRIGSYGAIGIALTLLLKFSALSALLAAASASTFCLTLLAGHGVSRLASTAGRRASEFSAQRAA